MELKMSFWCNGGVSKSLDTRKMSWMMLNIEWLLPLLSCKHSNSKLLTLRHWHFCSVSSENVITSLLFYYIFLFAAKKIFFMELLFGAFLMPHFMEVWLRWLLILAPQLPKFLWFNEKIDYASFGWNRIR